MPIFNTDAIVLKQFDLGESDKIITFYSKDKGKIRAVAKNARKGNSSISGRVLPFSFNNITIYRGSSIDKINQVKSKYSFTDLREDLTKMAYASFMAEIVEKVGMEDDPLPAIFTLLLSSFNKMRKVSSEKLIYINLIFQIRILVILGFKPEVNKCVLCEKDIKPAGKNYFDISSGGIICHKCLNNADEEELSRYRENLFILSGESLQIIKQILALDEILLNKLKISSKSINEIESLLDKFIKYHLDLNLKSKDFLYKIRDLG
ncbi:MAG: DNA repair protein RecO [Bacillota bacterium]